MPFKTDIVATILATKSAIENGKIQANISQENMNGNIINGLTLSDDEVLLAAAKIVPNMPGNIAPNKQKNKTNIKSIVMKSKASACAA